ncbi:hypothetical protein [Mesorhizobium sp. 1B3]
MTAPHHDIAPAFRPELPVDGVPSAIKGLIAALQRELLEGVL